MGIDTVIRGLEKIFSPGRLFKFTQRTVQQYLVGALVVGAVSCGNPGRYVPKDAYIATDAQIYDLNTNGRHEASAGPNDGGIPYDSKSFPDISADALVNYSMDSGSQKSGIDMGADTLVSFAMDLGNQDLVVNIDRDTSVSPALDSGDQDFGLDMGSDAMPSTSLDAGVPLEEICAEEVPRTENRPPIMAPIGSKRISEGGTLSFTLSASDPDEDNILYSAINLPAGATFEQEIKTFFWNPDYTQAGEYIITFSATDSELADSEVVSIEVTDREAPDCIIPVDGMEISETTIFCEGEYYLPNGISIISDEISLDGGSSRLYADYETGVDWEDSEGILLQDILSVTLKNLNIERYFRAITCINSNNILIENNNLLTEDGNTALSLQRMGYSLMRNNVISGTTYVLTSYYNKFFNNTYNREGRLIISILDWSATSHHTFVEQNNFNGWTNNIYLGASTYGNVINNNELRDISVPINIMGSNNVIKNNTMESSTIGIQIVNTDEFPTNNRIYGNTISNTARYCVRVALSSPEYETASSNILYNNNFSNCNTLTTFDEAHDGCGAEISTCDVEDNRESSTWSTTCTGGNHWDEYDSPAEGCFDADSNGICDEPYQIDEDSFDLLPFVEPNGWD